MIREVTQGIVAHRWNVAGSVPFNLMKSEKMVWIIQDAGYLETVVRQEHHQCFSTRRGRPADQVDGGAHAGMAVQLPGDTGAL